MEQKVSISAGELTASIDQQGAELTSFKRAGDEYLWQADARWWPKHAPVLFPIVGSVRGDTANSKQGPVKFGRHGFARDNVFEVAEQTDSSVTLELKDTEATRAAYPYQFCFQVSYSLNGPASLTQTYRVENTGEVELPFSVGGHPAFNVPAPGTLHERFTDYDVIFTEPWTCTVPRIADGGLMTYDTAWTAVDNTDTLPMTHELFATDAVMLTDVPGRTLTLKSRVSGRGVRIDFPDYKYIGIWSAAGDAPFIALEPWTGHSTLTSEDDVFEHKRDITILAPGEVDTRSFTVTLL